MISKLVIAISYDVMHMNWLNLDKYNNAQNVTLAENVL